jgi:RNase P subunit RPR2
MKVILHECHINIRFIILQKIILFKAIVRLGGNSLKVECDDWYGRNLNAEQRDDGLKCIKDEKRLALVEEELAEQSKELAEQSKELAETKKKQIELEQEQRKELAETNRKLIELKQELEQEQSKSVPKNIRGKYCFNCVSLEVNTD